MSDLTERLFRVLKKHPTLKTKEALAKHLGCSRSMLFHYENGNPEPPLQLLTSLVSLEIALGIETSTAVESGSGENPKRLGFPPNEILEDDGDVTRQIPVIGWAHAGHAASYEEIPIDWQQTIPSDCRDINAFAVTLEGDSMEPLFRDGDLLVLLPSQRIYNGCLAVLRLASDGVLLRRVELREQRIRLVPLNPRYEVEELACDQVMWAYPVWGSWRQIWK